MGVGMGVVAWEAPWRPWPAVDLDHGVADTARAGCGGRAGRGAGGASERASAAAAAAAPGRVRRRRRPGAHHVAPEVR